MLKILIVEDNTIYRQIIKDNLYLDVPSIIIEEAADGIEAMKKIDDFLPHLIFMDIKLPGENGLELTRKIKISHPHIAVIVLTSYDLPEYRQAALDYGASAFITKDSFSIEAVQSLLESMSLTNQE